MRDMIMGFIAFILTFCSESLYKSSENKLLIVAGVRLLMIIFGSFIALMVNICIHPVWIGQELQNQISSNVVKLADL